ncbi:MAG: hypothetical protein FWC03_07425 [Treponema sp.]|nr:hypothetical protein [Treponema sp.]
MSRSYKKHCGYIICSGMDKLWKKQWHSAMRVKERDLLNQQKKFPEDDYCYPYPREIDDLWCAPSDGGSHWMYSGFNHYFFEQTHPLLYWWGSSEIPTRDEAWKEWKKDMIGK